MAKFLYLYTEGRMPETPEGIEEMMGKWNAYFGKLGSKLVDPGAPFGDRACVGPATATPVSGYSVIEADNLDAAKGLTDGHPHIEFDGGIEVIQCMEM